MSIAKGSTILVIEDDEETLNVLCRTLAAGGYDVMWARNGEDTMKLLTRHVGPISLVVTDVVLPGMSGKDVMDSVCSEHPEALSLFVSAYDEETVREKGVDPETMRFLPKPYEPDALLTVVKETLGAR